MPKLQTYRDYHLDATKKVSENTRTLALSAIGMFGCTRSQNLKVGLLYQKN